MAEESLQNDSVGGSSNAGEKTNDIEASEYQSSSQRLDDICLICRTPPSSYNACDNVYGATFPRRSQRKKNVVCRNILRTSTAGKISSRTAVKRGIEVASKVQECASEEGTPSWKRKQRFMMENCSSSISGSVYKSTTNNDPNVTIDWLMVELQHRRSVGEFHKDDRIKKSYERKRGIEKHTQ
ncbi:uncharacterized protein [Linepithema humile]|uniref:uncharacterized protein isoform X2 n=1 Tax=Linepithema humile TaxID=83485 RepID=UPI00062308A6|nr:PREDICTED: uncharacterized protein LOC105669384 isoform X3 [Linepithema humile]